MNIELTTKEYRRLLDLVYIGNWILNSTRGADRISDYDKVMSAIFARSKDTSLAEVCDVCECGAMPSREFVEGGIHEAIMDYEDTIFFEILAEELARRDMVEFSSNQEDSEELNNRISEYISEFEQNGTDNVLVDI